MSTETTPVTPIVGSAVTPAKTSHTLFGKIGEVIASIEHEFVVLFKEGETEVKVLLAKLETKPAPVAATPSPAPAATPAPTPNVAPAAS